MTPPDRAALHLPVAVPAAALLLLAPAPASAAPPDTGWALLQMVLALALVIGLLVGCLWLLRRLRIGQGVHGTVLKVVASAAVGPRENVVVVEIGEQWLVLGVAPGNVRLLQTCPRGQAAATDSSGSAAFASRLLESLRRSG